MKTKAKIITLLLSLVAAFALCFAFAGCNDDGNTGDKGDSQNSGNSENKGNSEARPEWEVYAGVYKFESLTTVSVMTVAGQTINSTTKFVKNEEQYGITYSENYMVITLNSDGTGTMTTDMGDMGDTSVSAPVEGESNFTWSVEDGELKLDTSGSIMTWQIEGDTFCYEVVVNMSYGTSTSTFELKKAS